MQPVDFAADPQAGFVEAAHPPGMNERRDPLDCRRKRLGAAPRPFRHARRAKPRRVKQIGQRLGRPVLRDQLLGVQIDRRSPNALAVSGRPARLGRKGRPGAPAAAGAGLRQGPGVRSPRAAAPADRTPDAAPSPPPSPGSGGSRNAGRPQPRASRSGRARRSGEAFRPCAPSARRLAARTVREGSRASSSTRRSRGASNSSNCPDPAGAGVPRSQPATLPAPAEATQSGP